MAIGDRYELSIQGQVCGALFSLGSNYIQVAADLGGATPGQSLVEGWIVPAGSPWKAIRALLTTDLTITCAVFRSPEDQGTVFVEAPNNAGTNANTPLPSTVAMLIEIWAQSPWLKNFGGRQFVPGFTQQHEDGDVWIPTIGVVMAPYIAALKNITPTGAAGTMFKLLPKIDMTSNPTVLTNASVLALDVWVDPILRRIHSRLPDQCAIAAAQGAPAGSESLTPGA